MKKIQEDKLSKYVWGGRKMEKAVRKARKLVKMGKHEETSCVVAAHEFGLDPEDVLGEYDSVPWNKISENNVKITEEKLRRLIREEIQKLNEKSWFNDHWVDSLPPRWTETSIKKAWNGDDLRWISDNIERSATGEYLGRSPIRNIKTSVLLKALIAYKLDKNHSQRDRNRAEEILDKAFKAVGVQKPPKNESYKMTQGPLERFRELDGGRSNRPSLWAKYIEEMLNDRNVEMSAYVEKSFEVLVRLLREEPEETKAGAILAKRIQERAKNDYIETIAGIVERAFRKYL